MAANIETTVQSRDGILLEMAHISTAGLYHYTKLPCIRFILLTRVFKTLWLVVPVVLGAMD